jgi:hypothetical protein
MRFDQAMKQVELDTATWTRLVMLVTFVIPTRADASPLVPFLSDPLLLQYDAATGSFAETLEHAALNDLVQEIAGFNLAKAKFDWAELLKGKNANNPPVPVDGVQLAGALHLLLRWARVSTLALALARSMDGRRLVLPRPLPKGPFVDQEAALTDEQLSIEDVRAFIAEDN